MAVADSKAVLSRALKDLRARWHDVQSVWADAQSQQFDKTYMLLFEQDVRSALTALDQIDQVVQRIESDCR
jgi:hypothetical protein